MVPAAQEALRSLHAGLASCLSYLRRRVLPYAADALAAASSDAWAAAGLVAHQLDEMYPHLSLALLLLIGALLAWRCCCGGGPADKRWGGSSSRRVATTAGGSLTLTLTLTPTPDDRSAGGADGGGSRGWTDRDVQYEILIERVDMLHSKLESMSPTNSVTNSAPSTPHSSDLTRADLPRCSLRSPTCHQAPCGPPPPPVQTSPASSAPSLPSAPLGSSPSTPAAPRPHSCATPHTATDSPAARPPTIARIGEEPEAGGAPTVEAMRQLALELRQTEPPRPLPLPLPRRRRRPTVEWRECRREHLEHSNRGRTSGRYARLLRRASRAGRRRTPHRGSARRPAAPAPRAAPTLAAAAPRAPAVSAG